MGKSRTGPQGLVFPWGNQFDASNCNSISHQREETTPVNLFPQGGSPYGVYDLVSNVWEWTLDKVGVRGLGRQYTCIIKGGSFKSPQSTLRCEESSACAPNFQRDDIGFRCVWSAYLASED